MEIPGLRGLGPWELIKQSVNDFIEDDMATYAAALAYQVLFSIFPFIVFLVALLGVLHVPQFFDWLVQQAQAFLPQQAMEQVQQVIDEVQQPQGGLLSLGIILAIWIASAGVRSTMNAMNVAYDVEEARPAWKRYPLSIVYTIGIALMIILGAGLMLTGEDVMSWLARQVGLEQAFITVWNYIRWPIGVLLLMLAVAVAYYALPDVDQDFKFITPGSIIAVLVWVITSIGFGYYIRNFADYSATYGSLGAVIVLLFYFYISAAVLLFGCEVNAVIEHHSPEGKDPGEKMQDQHKQPARWEAEVGGRR